MLKRKMNSGLRQQLVFIFALSIFLVMVTQLFYCIRILQKNTEQNTENCYSIIRQTDSMLTLASERISSIGSTVSSNEYVQELLYLNNTNDKENLKRRMELMGFINNYLDGIIGANDELNNIVLIDNNESILSMNTSFDYINYKTMKEDYDLDKMNQGFFTSWYDFGTGRAFSNGFGYVIPVFYTTGDFNSISQKLGICIIWCNENPLIEIVKNTAPTEFSTVLIADSKGFIMALNSEYNITQISGEIDEMLIQYNLNSNKENIKKMKFMKEKSFVLVKVNESTGWKSINIVPIKRVYSETFQTFYQGMMLAILSILILLSFGLYLIHSITKPLVHITTVLDSIGKGNRKKRIEELEKNEFGMIGASINRMLDNVDTMNHRIFDMQSQLYEKELIQKEAEMLTLQSQINPHFLYNTLECIRAIAIIHKIKEIPSITTSMANIFRYSIKGGLLATIKMELDCINDYYKIIAIRYAGRLKLSLDVDEKLLTHTILKMSLQPIIENSVNHGLEETEDEVSISIKGCMDEGYAYFTISDNGVGMETEKVDELNAIFEMSSNEEIVLVGKSKGSIGLSNINARLKLHYGKECGLKIESTKNIGTQVTVRLKLVDEQ